MKNIFPIFIFLTILLSFHQEMVYAGTAQNVSGFAWGGTTDVTGGYPGIGWISFNNTSDGSPTAYGVTLPPTDANLTGNAWSEHYGWLTFDSANLAGCPSAPCKAYRVGNTIQGWARFTSIANAGANAGGWTGWVSLSGTASNGVAYGVTIGANNLSGYAWSDELGWIDMGTVIYTGPPTVEIHFSFFDRVKISLEKLVNITKENSFIERAFAWGGNN